MWEETLSLADSQMSKAPWFIERMQTLRRTAYVMCTNVHLMVWKKLDMKFMSLYNKKYSGNLRAPDVK
jgi:hypothetical protein